MKTQTIELPKLRRARTGHVIYATGEESICSVHQFCSFSGDERERCPNCHSNAGLCDDDACGGLPPGRTRPCFCSKCEELFTSITAFDAHIRTVNGVVKCLRPERRGLVIIEQNGWQLWGKPGSPPPR